MKNRPIRTCLTFSVFLLAIRCGGSDEDARGQMLIQRQCTLTTCEARQRRCLATKENQCSSCWAAVSESVSYGGGFYDCASICDSSSCYRTCPSGDSCEQYEFTVQLPKGRDEALFEACEQAMARHVECGTSRAASANCDIFARVERADAVGIYQCLARTPCDQSIDHCNNLPPSGVAQSYCDGYSLICGAGPDVCANPALMDRDFFNWNRDQVNTELLRCLELDCEAAQECLGAYFSLL